MSDQPNVPPSNRNSDPSKNVVNITSTKTSTGPGGGDFRKLIADIISKNTKAVADGFKKVELKPTIVVPSPTPLSLYDITEGFGEAVAPVETALGSMLRVTQEAKESTSSALVGMTSSLSSKFDDLIGAGKKSLDFTKNAYRDARIDRAEADAEKQKMAKPDLNAFKDVALKHEAGLSGLIKSGMLAVTGVAAAGIGFILELPMIRQLKNKFITSGQKLKDVWDAFSTTLTKVLDKVRNTKLSTFVVKMWDSVLKPFRAVRDFFAKVKNKLKLNIASEKIGQIFTKVKDVFSGLFNRLKGVAKAGIKIGKILGKLAWPITVLISTVQGIIDAFKGYDEEGAAGAFKGFVLGFLNGLVGDVLEMIKNGISWLFEKVGLTDASEWLDSWNFKEIFSGAWDYLAEKIPPIIDTISDFMWMVGDAIYDVHEWLSEKIGVGLAIFNKVKAGFKTFDLASILEFALKTQVRSVIPPASPDLPNYTPAGMMQALMKSGGVYEWLGSKVKTRKEKESNIQDNGATTNLDKTPFVDMGDTVAKLRSSISPDNEFKGGMFEVAKRAVGGALSSAGVIGGGIVINNISGGTTVNSNTSNTVSNSNTRHNTPMIAGSAMSF